MAKHNLYVYLIFIKDHNIDVSEAVILKFLVSDALTDHLKVNVYHWEVVIERKKMIKK